MTADQQTPPASPEPPAPPSEPAPPAEPAVVVRAGDADVTAETLEVLGLAADATPGEYRAALAALGERAERIAALEAELAQARETADALRAAEAQRADVELAAMLEPYDLGDAERATLMGLLRADRPAAEALLAKLPKRPAMRSEPAAPSEPAPPSAPSVPSLPPAPTHDPAATDAGATEADLAARVAARAREMQAADRRLSWADAELRARREIAA